MMLVMRFFFDHRFFAVAGCSINLDEPSFCGSFVSRAEEASRFRVSLDEHAGRVAHELRNEIEIP